MKHFYFPVLSALAFSSVLVLSGCGGGAKAANSGVTLTSLKVTPAAPSIAQSSTQQFTATGTFSDGSTSNVTAQATWTSSSTSKATITNSGLATGTGVGISTIGTSHGGLLDSTLLTVTAGSSGAVRIAYLHHSTGGNVWAGGIPAFFTAYNAAHGTKYQITEITYPATSGGYPWANYPYDYWNLWVNHTGASQDQGELNLDQIDANYDVIVFKHCYPVSDIEADNGSPSLSSPYQTMANYQLQYAALKTRMKQFPTKKFILWTGPARNIGSTSPANALRAQSFVSWVKSTWNEPGDNIFLWDFYALETAGTAPYMNDTFASAASDPHPNPTFSATVAPYISQRIVDVIEGRGDTASITGH